MAAKLPEIVDLDWKRMDLDGKKETYLLLYLPFI